MVTREWWEGHRDRPQPVELDVCPVCDAAVLDDPQNEQPGFGAVRMPDGYWTHRGPCEADYPAVVARLEAADGGDPVEYEDPLIRRIA